MVHLKELEEYLKVIRSSGITLNLKKCRFAQKEVKFCGELIGGGKQRANPDKLSVIQEMQRPQTKTELRHILGFFFLPRAYTRLRWYGQTTYQYDFQESL